MLFCNNPKIDNLFIINELIIYFLPAFGLLVELDLSSTNLFYVTHVQKCQGLFPLLVMTSVGLKN